ncbi:unnamed protein product [Bursaphelenchus xylophilus]|uniref:(pine wood nematode) hypothetical protein n=1 Tax=Bursaphelenchus xylophilus TaxID=6326 RepID=A0A1I7SSI5_BURXY|nr:unnamed protein product [Bursaphelenchus xylophilus]CAG9097512.1 unnamed protein product [Bursaphelenchus xylophilus]
MTATVKPETDNLSSGLGLADIKRDNSNFRLENEPNKEIKEGITVVHKDDIDSQAPLIILTGWANATDKNLSKYSEFYVDEGYMVARYTVPIKEVYHFGGYQRYALTLYEQLLQLDKTEGRPIFIHNFSMNGCSLFAMLWRLLAEVADGESIKARVKGVIFDSSPANVMPWHVAEALSMGHKAWGLKMAVKVATTSFLSVHRFCCYATSLVKPNVYETQFAYFMLTSFTDLPKRQLYFYSENDPICLPSSIREFQSLQRNQGVVVDELTWPNAGHCSHLKDDREPYVDKCVTFIRGILK